MNEYTCSENFFYDFDPVYGIAFCNETIGTEFCKNLKGTCEHSGNINLSKNTNGLICGCPLSSGNVCRVTRDQCQKHYDWEGTKISELHTLQLRCEQIRHQQRKREKKLRKRIVNRWLETKK